MDALSCVILPGFCNFCGTPLPQLSSAPICDVCWTEIHAQSGPVCARCGDSLGDQQAGHARQTHSPKRANLLLRFAELPACASAVRACRCFWSLSAPHETSHSRSQIRPASPSGARAGANAGRRDCSIGARSSRRMLVVPVPLHRTKYSERGFNQARSLAVQALASLRKSHPAVAPHAGVRSLDASARNRQSGRLDSA